MRLGAVVLSHDPGDVIVATVDALDRSLVSPAETLVVDNASTKASLEPLLTAYRSIEILRLESNDGYGAAMNAAATELVERGMEAVLFLTQETLLAPDALGHLLAGIADGRTGAAGPILCRRSDRGQVWSAGGEVVGLRRSARHLETGRCLNDVARENRQVDWLDGACLLVPTNALRACGGFREDLFLYWEDVDICRRLDGLGWRITCVGAAVAFQEPSMTPPYLGARNRTLVLGRSGAVGVGLDVVRYAVADVVRGRGLRRTLLAGRGLRDARRQEFDRSIALDRPT